MAKLVPSDTAPAEDFKFSTAQVTVDLPYETDDPDVIANALAHPWVDVDFGELPEDNPPSTSLTLPAELDGLSRVNSKANDPEAVRAALEEREKLIAPVAIDAALDQKESEFTGPAAVTVAAADEQEPAKATEGASHAAALKGVKPAKPKSTTKQGEQE